MSKRVELDWKEKELTSVTLDIVNVSELPMIQITSQTTCFIHKKKRVREKVGEESDTYQASLDARLNLKVDPKEVMQGRT
jgi:hypothetical protein